MVCSDYRIVIVTFSGVVIDYYYTFLLWSMVIVTVTFIAFISFLVIVTIFVIITSIVIVIVIVIHHSLL